MVLGVAIIYLLVATDSTLHTEKDVEMYLKLPVLASLPDMKSVAGQRGKYGAGSIMSFR